MYFRVTIPALQDGKRDEAVSYVKEKVMPEFTGTPGLLTMMAAITGENSGINLSCYDSKESLEAAQEKIQGVLSGAASLMSAPPVVYEGEAVYGKVYQTMAKDSQRPRARLLQDFQQILLKTDRKSDLLLNLNNFA